MVITNVYNCLAVCQSVPSMGGTVFFLEISIKITLFSLFQPFRVVLYKEIIV